MVTLPPLHIGNIVAETPVIQGGMGVRISTSALAAAVAREGGIGVIGSVALGFSYPNRGKLNYFEANKKALAEEIQKAKQLSDGGIIGVNNMVAITDYEEMVRVSVDNGADLILSGAGLPLSLPGLVDNADVKLLPIVSSLRALKVIYKKWERRYKKIPDAIIVESPSKAAGHLGAKDISDVHDPGYRLEKVVPEIVAYLASLGVKIPVIAAGGIWDHEDIRHMMFDVGASGVQMGTRFVCTDECEAAVEFKQAYINAKKDDITLLQSPVGLPGRALKNRFTENLKHVPPGVKCRAKCLEECNPKEIKYCIVAALDNAQKGNLDEGIIFAGSNVYKSDRIIPVKELMYELKTGKKMTG